jgi:hypothetical protein
MKKTKTTPATTPAASTATGPIVFLDSIGRTILGKVKEQTSTTLVVQNPTLVHVQPNAATNQLQLQLLPLFFKEFLSDKDEATTWSFNKANITLMSQDVSLAPQFVAQFEQLWASVPPPPPQETKVVKLFDEE